MEKYTVTQSERLSELNCSPEEQTREFETKEERNEHFRKLEKELTRYARNDIFDLLESRHMTKYRITGNKMAEWLMGEGFTEVITPTIISRDSLKKMGIDSGSQFLDQVFWVDGKHCLRPMLAPNLYVEMRELLRITKKPVKIFEMGSCFRKESEGNIHLKEFTMLNLVEWGTPMEQRNEHLREFASLVMKAAGITDYHLEDETSVVYGKGIDVTGSNGLELASSSMGPHPLDAAWKVTCTWTGIGFGLERLLMYREKANGIHRYSRSNVFLDGAALKVR